MFYSATASTSLYCSYVLKISSWRGSTYSLYAFSRPILNSSPHFPRIVTYYYECGQRPLSNVDELYKPIAHMDSQSVFPRLQFNAL